VLELKATVSVSIALTFFLASPSVSYLIKVSPSILAANSPATLPEILISKTLSSK
jgi:hypothetical protein